MQVVDPSSLEDNYKQVEYLGLDKVNSDRKAMVCMDLYRVQFVEVVYVLFVKKFLV